jgi:hypothetical protein
MRLDGNKFQRCQALPYSKEPNQRRWRFRRGHFILTEARDWCAEPHPGSSLQEIGADAVQRETKVKDRPFFKCDALET